MSGMDQHLSRRSAASMMRSPLTGTVDSPGSERTMNMRNRSPTAKVYHSTTSRTIMEDNNEGLTFDTGRSVVYGTNNDKRRRKKKGRCVPLPLLRIAFAARRKLPGSSASPFLLVSFILVVAVSLSLLFAFKLYYLVDSSAKETHSVGRIASRSSEQKGRKMVVLKQSSPQVARKTIDFEKNEEEEAVAPFFLQRRLSPTINRISDEEALRPIFLPKEMLQGATVVGETVLRRGQKVKRRAKGKHRNTHVTQRNSFVIPPPDVEVKPLPPDDEATMTKEKGEGGDYGGMTFEKLETWQSAREIQSPDSADLKGKIYTSKDFKSDDYQSGYYAVDDDWVRAQEFGEESGCRRPSWQLLYHSTCNSFHERPIDLMSHISNGYYRDVFSVEHMTADDFDSAILKISRYEHDFDYETFEYARNDALVMERLTSSPRIVDIYGHCGASVLTETLPGELEEYIVPGSGHLTTHRLHDEMDVDPQNEYTPTEKLQLALGMAEALADLHGFKDGVIVHDDVQLSQFLLDKNGNVKLNDFNRAEVMYWDEEKGEYCRYFNGRVWGNYRSPEEDEDRLLNEKIDIYSFGNNIYALLTGLWVYYGTQDDEVVQQMVTAGDLPFVDERYKTHSYAEGELVKIMYRCWTYNPDERADIFEVVEMLRAAILKNSRFERGGVSRTKPRMKRFPQ